jgi:RNA polymerase sigma-70 factor (ECF subfamily)
VTQLVGGQGVEEASSSWLATVDCRALASAISLICGDPTLAEEAMQEALLKGWEKARSGEQVDSWSAWIVTVALNYTRNHFRRIGRERIAFRKLALELRPDRPDPTEGVASSVDLVRAVSKLSRREREVVSLHYRLDMSVAEISVALRVQEGTVKTLLHRGREHLAPLVRSDRVSRLESRKPREGSE